jgi:hypothetical protein
MRTGARIRKPVAVAIAVAALLPVTPGLAGGATEVVSTSQRVAGKTYPQWMVASWQWLLANGRSNAAPQKGGLSCITRGERGSVWFLDNEYEGFRPVTVTCAIPASRYLFLQGPTFDCSTVEPAPFGAARATLQQCVTRFKLAGVKLTLDGKRLTPAAHSVATPAFRFSMPAQGNVLKVPGQTGGYAAARGDATMLRPLPAGRHTLVQVEQFSDGSTIETTWQLKVK